MEDIIFQQAVLQHTKNLNAVFSNYENDWDGEVGIYYLDEDGNSNYFRTTWRHLFDIATDYLKTVQRNEKH